MRSAVRAFPSSNEWASSRRASRSDTGLASRRRKANASAVDEDASSHWTSSTAIRTGSRPERAWRTLRTATPSARRSTASPGSRRSATSSARRCGGGRSGRTSSRTSSKRSPSPTWASPRSASAGRDERTRKPRLSASWSPAAQSIDFPMPGSPSSRSAACPPIASPRKARMDRNSSSLPMISKALLLGRW